MLILCIFSFTANFGNNIYGYIVLIMALSVIVENLLDLTFHDIFVRNGLSCLINTIASLITLGADDLFDFLISYLIEYAI